MCLRRRQGNPFPGAERHIDIQAYFSGSIRHGLKNMTESRNSPDASAGNRIPDAPKGNWVDRYAPDRARPYLRLSRADRPIGTWLLLIPCWWGLLLAVLADPGSGGWHDGLLAAAFAAGAFLMRGAGCTWNDITDRHLDAQVARTRTRPIPSGQVSVKGAAVWMTLQAVAAAGILFAFNPFAVTLAVAALIPAVVYPFAKRFTWWPQVFLGIAFNWGALLGWAAHTGSLGLPPILLYIAGIFWTLFYDTIYAHQDRRDDVPAGNRSTALLFGAGTRTWLFVFALLATALMALAAAVAIIPVTDRATQILAAFGIIGFASHLAYQLRVLDINDSEGCLALFRSNRDAGLIPACFFLLAAMV